MSSDSPSLCREACQGQEFGIASIPPMILFLEMTNCGIGAIPQILSKKYKFANSPNCYSGKYLK